MFFNNNIEKAINDKKIYNAVIINGLLEIETIQFFVKNNFKHIAFPEMYDLPFVNNGDIFFYKNDKRITLCSNQAMRISAASSLYDKVFCISDCFRNEYNNDGAHLSTFKMLEVEFKGNKEEFLFDIIEAYLKHMIDWFNNYIENKELTNIFKKIIVDFPIEKKEFDEIYDEIFNDKSIKYSDSIYFIDDEITKSISKPIFIMYYPSRARWRSLKKDDKHSYLYNLILPNRYGELFEFSLKEMDYEFYYSRFKENGSLDYYKWYLDSIKDDKANHSAFGMGIERLGAWLMGLESIDEQLLFSCIPEGGKKSVKLQ